MGYRVVAEYGPGTDRVRVFEHGWQSWSPSGWYALGETAPRPTAPNHHVMAYRPGVAAPGGPGRFQGEGLLAVDAGDGRVDVIAATSTDEIPSIRCEREGDRVVVRADGEVSFSTGEYAEPRDALAAWADAFAQAHRLAPVAVFGPSWCSWYAYWGGVTESDVLTNLAAFDRHELPVDLVLLDEGYQSEIGDWLTPRSDFGSTLTLASAIRDTGRKAGIWVAPFLVGGRSELARRHAEWLVPDVSAGTNWGQDLHVLDVTHPGAAHHLHHVFASLGRQGFDHFKLDFLYAGAIEGQRAQPVDGTRAYRMGLELIRRAVGPNRTLHGCGAPILPSAGLVDCMRVSPDTAPQVEPVTGDVSQPNQRGAQGTSRAREFLHGRWWANDPDCLIVGRSVQSRESWAEHIAASPGLRMSSDVIGELDEWGLATTRRLLVPSSPRPHQGRG